MDGQAQDLSYNPLLQRFFLSPEEKASKEKGRAIMKALYAQQTNNDSSLNFFKGRNARWIMLLLWAKGSQRMEEFLDYMNISQGEGNKAWVNIDLTQSRLAAQFVSTLVESMAKNKTYPCVNAIDDGSISEKEDRMLRALFRMREVETINDVQQQTGVQFEPDDAYVPDDEMSARVYFELEDRLPKEIRFEEMLNMQMEEIRFENILNRKTLYDLIVLNIGVTKIEKQADKKYTIRKCVPTNMVYNFFMNDNGECEITQIGEFYNLKVKDFRAKYGKSEQNPDGLTEKEIFELAKMSTTKNIGLFNYMWSENWALTTYTQNRPYDDSSILVFDCEINFEEEKYFVSKKDAFGKENIQAKKTVPYQVKTKTGEIKQQDKPDNVEILKKRKNTWMRGVYCPYGDKMLYWGKPDLIITPYTDIAKPLSSYTILIPNNDGEYVPSLFERIMEPLREYQLTKLKRKQLIAKIRPSGVRIDVESARNLDLGNGDSIAWEEVVRIFDQTGNEVWSSKGIDPLTPTAPPISNTVANNIQDVIGLTNILAGIVNEIRQLIGVPMYRDGSDVGDRTAARLAEGQNQASYNVTDFVLNANNELWQETFYKICLLHWNDIVREEPESKNDMINTRFQVTVKMKPTEYQKQLLEQDIQRYSQVIDGNGNPLLSPKDAMMLREIDNYKLAQWYLASTIEKNKRDSMRQSMMLQEQNAKVQQQSLQMKAKADKQLQNQKLESEKQLAEFKALQEIKLEIVKGSFQIASKTENPTMPAWLVPIVTQIIPNLEIPLSVENNNMQVELQQQAQQEEQEAQIMQISQDQGIPPEEVAAQLQQQ